MIEVESIDLLKDKDLLQKANLICITTNGFVKKNGEGVMGRGIAKQIANDIPTAPKRLGEILRNFGNHVHNFAHITDEKLSYSNHWIITFPVKHNWSDAADPELIRRSAIELKQLMEGRKQNILIPRPGCGNGRLNWIDVKPILEEVFGDDDRFIIVSRVEKVSDLGTFHSYVKSNYGDWLSKLDNEVIKINIDDNITAQNIINIILSVGYDCYKNKITLVDQHNNIIDQTYARCIVDKEHCQEITYVVQSKNVWYKDEYNRWINDNVIKYKILKGQIRTLSYILSPRHEVEVLVPVKYGTSYNGDFTSLCYDGDEDEWEYQTRNWKSISDVNVNIVADKDNIDIIQKHRYQTFTGNDGVEHEWGLRYICQKYLDKYSLKGNLIKRIGKDSLDDYKDVLEDISYLFEFGEDAIYNDYHQINVAGLKAIANQIVYNTSTIWFTRGNYNEKVFNDKLENFLKKFSDYSNENIGLAVSKTINLMLDSYGFIETKPFYEDSYNEENEEDE